MTKSEIAGKVLLRRLRRRSLFVALAALALPLSGFAQSSFSIEKIVRWERAPGERHGIYEAEDRFVPSVEAQLRVTADVETAGLVIKAYFFGPTRKLVAVGERPDPAYLPGVRWAKALPVADILSKNKAHSVFFRIPDALRGQRWTALVVFGDARTAVVKTLPAVDPRGFDFAERGLAFGGNLAGARAVSAASPAGGGGPLVFEHVARTKSAAQPQITMFFRMPPGVVDARELRGLICVVAVGTGVEDVKRQLLTLDADPERADLGKLAVEHRLGILTWGARTLWKKGVPYEELTPEERATEAREFGLAADGWAAGLDEMSRKYGIPNGNILINGDSQGAQWACRLVQRMPERFLAAGIRLGSTFDPPRPAAARVLWMLYDGELDGGYANNLEYYDACRALGYPIILKTDPGVKHYCPPLAGKLQNAFYKWALELEGTQPRVVAAPPTGARPQPWPVSLRTPPFWGDVLGQKVVPAGEVESIDPANRVPLPTEAIATAWEGKEPAAVPRTP